VKITKGLILNVVAFTAGSVAAEFMLQREERRREHTEAAPRVPLKVLVLDDEPQS
jgi:hypothetical protein